MARRVDRQDSGGIRPGGARRLIAGLRVTQQDEALLAVVRPYLTEAGSEGEVAYRTWRRGLEITLGEVISLGADLPPGTTEELIASLVAQRLLLCMPLLRRTGRLTLLGIEALLAADGGATATAPSGAPLADSIDAGAADAIAGLGGSDFL